MQDSDPRNTFYRTNNDAAVQLAADKQDSVDSDEYINQKQTRSGKAVR